MAKFKAFGAQLQVTIGTTLTTIAQIRRITGPGITVDTADVTTFDSTGGWREFLGTLVDGGELTFDLVFDPVAATHQALTDVLDGTVVAYNIIWTDTASTPWPFSGILTGFEPGGEVDGEMTASCSIKVTGRMTLPT